MTLAILTLPPWETYDRTPVLPVLNQSYGEGAEIRAALEGLERYRWIWPMRLTASELATWQEFARLRSQTVESFLIKDVKFGYARTNVALGTSTVGQTEFVIPTTGVNAHDYPVDDANAILYDDGSPVSKTVSVDDRKFTAAASPATGSIMSADYHFYRRVRLVAPATEKPLAPGWIEVGAELLEVTT